MGRPRVKIDLTEVEKLSGKTVAGAYEATCHLTGRSPSWWKGRRFDKATDGWACGTNSQTTRDVVQGVLLAEPRETG